MAEEGGCSLPLPKESLSEVTIGRRGDETGSLYMAKLRDPTSTDLPLAPKDWNKGVCTTPGLTFLLEAVYSPTLQGL